MKLSVNRRSSLWSVLVLLSSYVIFARALPQAQEQLDKVKDATTGSKFSRLLSAKADLLKYSSISNANEKIPFISVTDIANLATAAPKQSMSVSSSFSMSTSSKSNAIIPQSSASVADHTDMILQSYRAPLFEFSERSPSATTSTDDSSLVASSSQSNSTEDEQVGLLRRPVSRRGPASVLQQITTGNKLNLTPLFAEPQVVDDNEQELSDTATNNYPTYSEYSSSANSVPATTFLPRPQPTSAALNETEEYYDDDEPAVTTDLPSTSTTTSSTTTITTTARPVAAVAQGRSRNRGVNLRETTTTKAPTTTAPTTTTSTTTTVRPLTTTPKEDPFQDNLVFVNPRRSGKDLNIASRFDNSFVFPDFEDSPASLVTAESSQPARVNVRPASSGKEYEYEYIYYYYDDDDEDNNTSTTTTPGPATPTTAATQTQRPSKVETIGIKGTETFTPEKVPAKFSPPTDPSGNHLDRSRGSKAFETEQPIYSTVDQPSFSPPTHQRPQQTFVEYSPDDYYQSQAAPEEYPESIRTNTQPQPVVIKQSNLVQQNQEPATTLPPPTRPPTTTTEEPVQQVPAKSRFRTKPNFDSPPANQFVVAPVATEDVAGSPQVEHRPVYKELTSRRIPQRRPEVAEVPPEAQSSPQENVRLPTRTRFPPRVSPTAAHEEVTPVQQVVQVHEPVRQYQQQVLQEPVLPVYYEAVPQQFDPPGTTLPPRFLDAEQEAKAKENYARQKSINDLYALTRLHQLAINTRVPNRKELEIQASPVNTHRNIPPQVAGGFISSSEAAEEPDNYEEPRTYLPTTASTTTTTETVTTPVPEVTSEVPARATLPIRNRGFRGRTRPTGSPSSTTETAARQPVAQNRFTGRRRNFPQPSTGEPTGTADPVTAASPQTTPVRPGRNRFAGGRLRTSTTARPTEEVAEHVVPSVSAFETEQEAPKPPRRQRPGFANRRKQAQQATAEVSEVTTGTAAPPTPGGEKRRLNAARARPGPGAGPIVGRPLKSRTSTTPPEPIEQEQEVGPTEPISYVPANPTVAAFQEQEPVVSQKVSVSSSSTVSESIPEVPKRGSSAVLGRLRNRTKPGSAPSTPAATPTTPAPATSPVTERKPSRLNGILNRRKNGPPPAEASPTNVVTQTVANEEIAENPSHVEDVVTPKGGVIVAVSSVVSESQEVADHEDESSATPASILNRLKSQRKPGSLFRKRTEQQ